MVEFELVEYLTWENKLLSCFNKIGNILRDVAFIHLTVTFKVKLFVLKWSVWSPLLDYYNLFYTFVFPRM